MISKQPENRFRTRLTHSLEVAQIARQIARRVAEAASPANPDPDVVEAAALIHDLGHPPFGHEGEQALDSMLKARGVAEGFEGNAQTFRVVTKLAANDPWYPGLNLTRATLNACLKYPWYLVDRDEPARATGIYESEADCFEWARSTLVERALPVVEAQITELADDIGYAVHDFEDFCGAGLIPVAHLLTESSERTALLGALSGEAETRSWESSEMAEAMKRVLPRFATVLSSKGSERRTFLALAARELKDRFVQSVRIGAEGRVSLPGNVELELLLLKQLVTAFVHNHSEILEQRRAHRRVVCELFEILTDSPPTNREPTLAALLEGRVLPETETTDQRFRVVADVIAEMTDRQLTSLYERITGTSPILLDPIPLALDPEANEAGSIRS